MAKEVIISTTTKSKKKKYYMYTNKYIINFDMTKL